MTAQTARRIGVLIVLSAAAVAIAVAALIIITQ